MRIGLVNLSRYKGVQVYTAPNWPDHLELVCLTCKKKKHHGQFPIQEYHRTRIAYRVHCVACFKRWGEIKRFNDHALYTPELHDHLARCLRTSSAGSGTRGLMFDLRIGHLFRMFYEQNGMCAISGIPMTVASEGSKTHPHNVSIDRIDSARGYVPGNVHLVCYQVNIMKMEMTVDQLRYWCAHIALHFASMEEANDESESEDERAA